MNEAIKLLEELRDSLPQTHPDRPGVVRSIEVLRDARHDARTGAGVRDSRPLRINPYPNGPHR